MSENIPVEEIVKEVQQMGYITVKPREISPSYYKLKDGTIVKVLININHLVPDPRSPDGFAVSSTNIITAFVPKEKRNPTLAKPYTPSELRAGITDEDMEPITLKEDFSVYELSNGLILSLKTVAG